MIAKSKYHIVHMMKKLWLFFSLIPGPFLFHYYEYRQHIKSEEPKFLLLGTILLIVIAGFLAGTVKFRTFILVHIISCTLSVYFASMFIVDDGYWFTPVGRDLAVIFIAIVFFIGQFIISVFSKVLFTKRG